MHIELVPVRVERAEGYLRVFLKDGGRRWVRAARASALVLAPVTFRPADPSRMEGHVVSWVSLDEPHPVPAGIDPDELRRLMLLRAPNVVPSELGSADYFAMTWPEPAQPWQLRNCAGVSVGAADAAFVSRAGVCVTYPRARP